MLLRRKGGRRSRSHLQLDPSFTESMRAELCLAFLPICGHIPTQARTMESLCFTTQAFCEQWLSSHKHTSPNGLQPSLLGPVRIRYVVYRMRIRRSYSSPINCCLMYNSYSSAQSQRHHVSHQRTLQHPGTRCTWHYSETHYTSAVNLQDNPKQLPACLQSTLKANGATLRPLSSGQQYRPLHTYRSLCSHMPVLLAREYTRTGTMYR